MFVVSVAVHKGGKEACVHMGRVPTRFVSPKKDAIERYRLNFGHNVPKESLAILQLNFTELGVARFTVETCGPEHHFSSRLRKQTYGDKAVDWKVWHFVGDLPIDLPDVLLEVSWSVVI